MLSNDAVNARCIAHTGASCYLAGQLTSECRRRRIHGLALPTQTKQRKPSFLPALPPRLASPGGPVGWVPGLALLRSPFPHPSPICPPSHRWFLPATEIQEAAPHPHPPYVSSTRFFSGALSHTQFGVIWSSPFSASWEIQLPQFSHSFFGTRALPRRLLWFESDNFHHYFFKAYLKLTTKEQMWGCWLYRHTHTCTQRPFTLLRGTAFSRHLQDEFFFFFKL